MVFNTRVYLWAKSRFPEFDGWKGCKYPGTPVPRRQVFTARRNVSQAEEELDLKKLLNPDKSRPAWTEGEAHIIYVTPSTPVMKNPCTKGA